MKRRIYLTKATAQGIMIVTYYIVPQYARVRVGRERKGVMTQKKARWIWNIFGAITALLTVLVGCLFIKQTWGIFLSEETNPYTTQKVFRCFLQITPVLLCWVVFVCIGVLCSVFLPAKEERLPKYDNVGLRIRRLKARLPDEGKLVKGAAAWRIFRYAVWIVCAMLGVCVSGVCLYYLTTDGYSPMFDGAFFTEHGAVADRLVKISPWILAMGMLVFAAYYSHSFAMDEEEALLKKAVADKAVKDKELRLSGKSAEEVRQDEVLSLVNEIMSKCAAKGKTEQAQKMIDKALKKKGLAEKKYRLACEKTERKRAEAKARAAKCAKYAGAKTALVWLARGALFAVGVVCVIQGITGGGMAAVLEKAVNLCTQCIGLG